MTSYSYPESFTAQRVILFFGCALRLQMAVWTLDLLHPDEHFQSIEPASYVVTEVGFLFWEWIERVRSWFVPALYTPLIAFFQLLKIKGGAAVILGCRVMTACFSCVALFCFNRLLRDRKLSSLAHHFTLAWMAFCPAMILYSSATLGDTLTLDWIWIIMPWLVTKMDSKASKQVMLSGFLMGFCFLIRIQTALWGAVLFFYLFFSPKRAASVFSRKNTQAGNFLAGYTCAFLLQGLLDWATWGIPFISTYKNFRLNFLENVASHYGVSPWGEYFSELLEIESGFILLILGILIFLGWMLNQLRLTRRDLLIVLPAAVFFLAHCFIPHKEFRFIIPALPAFIYLAGVLFDHLIQGVKQIRNWSERYRNQAWIAMGALGVLSICFTFRIERFSSRNLAELMLVIEEENLLKEGDCLIMNEICWSRGALLFGKQVRFVEQVGGYFNPKDLLQCKYAVLNEGAHLAFVSQAGLNWKVVAQGRGKAILYRRVDY